jgi:hypothetical protein
LQLPLLAGLGPQTRPLPRECLPWRTTSRADRWSHAMRGAEDYQRCSSAADQPGHAWTLCAQNTGGGDRREDSFRLHESWQMLTDDVRCSTSPSGDVRAPANTKRAGVPAGMRLPASTLGCVSPPCVRCSTGVATVEARCRAGALSGGAVAWVWARDRCGGLSVATGSLVRLDPPNSLKRTDWVTPNNKHGRGGGPLDA